MKTSEKSGAYNINFEFTHNLGWGARPGEDNWSFHFKAAIADGNPNYVNSSVVAGISGRPEFMGRSRDRFGLGVFHYDLSDALQESLGRFGFGDESGVEAYYRWWLTPWLDVSGDIQYINPARQGDDENVIAALRANIRF